MKVIVDQEACIGCGMCIDVCPKVFEYNSDNKSEAINENVTDASKEKIIESQQVCPVDAIKIVEDENITDTSK